MSLAGKKSFSALAAVLLPINPELVRRLRDRGADVRVAMTEAAKAFITHLACRRFLVIPFPTVCWTRQPKPLWAILSWVNGLI